jgi:hypothetical protein
MNSQLPNLIVMDAASSALGSAVSTTIGKHACPAGAQHEPEECGKQFPLSDRCSENSLH